MGISQIVFIVIFGAAFLYALKNFAKIKRNIFLGKAEKIEGDTGTRFKNMLLVAFGQKKMFKRILPAIFHLFIYVAFLFTQIELIEIIIDGLGGGHRFFAGKIGALYPIIINSIEILSVLAFIATVIFLARRNLLKVPRLVMSEMNGWPKLDANLILIAEIILLIGVFTMNGTDVLLQEIDPAHYPDTGRLWVSSYLGPALFGGFSESTLILLERAGWWLHLLTVLAFLNYLPFSKHLHIFLAFPNTFLARLRPRGEMDNMPEIMMEVKSMMGLIEDTGEMSDELPEFGAKDVTDLSWKTLLDAYSCTECGRCTAVCPANLTGKKLSPRKIMMDIRDRATEIGNNIDSGDKKFMSEGSDATKLTSSNYDDGKSLFDYISREELHACTTCNACVEACPVMINPLDPILQMRRYEILTESAGPGDWLPMFTSIENSGSVWQVPDERTAWINS